MILRFYRKRRLEATLRITGPDDYHLSWHYKAADGISIWMGVLQSDLLRGKDINLVVLGTLLAYYDEMRMGS